MMPVTKLSAFDDETHVVRMASLLTATLPMLATVFTGVSPFGIAVPSVIFGFFAYVSGRAEGQARAFLLALSIIGQCITFTAAFMGHAWQIDAHMSFFAALAIVATMGSVPALLFAVVITAVHHLSFGILLPSLVYPSVDLTENLIRTLLHAVIVLFESGVLLLSMRAASRARRQIETGKQKLENTAEQALQAKLEAEEMGRRAGEVADRTRELGREAAVAIEQIASVAKTAASNANDSKQLVSRAKQDAEQSADVVRRTNIAMDAIRESSDGITHIVELIDEIARRTDLLALNAAVESARAGEAGRGFAVVANEVRKLAQQSADATLQIRSLVTTSRGRVAEGGALVSEAEKALARILTVVAELDCRMQEIATGADEQSTGLQQMSVAINRIDQVGSPEDLTAPPKLRLVG